MAEIVEQFIIDSTKEVGSGCEWTGKGTEPQWNNPKSTKAYDHISRHHGPKLKPNELMGRATSSNKDQGQWLNPDDWVNAEQLIPKYCGKYIIDFQRPIGRVYHADGKITESVTCAKIKRNSNGTLKYGYPVVNVQVFHN
ncbi:MAG: hypothetical protein EAZ09_09690 [Oscillatoriales cyanobacterium]|nr:MAG: hypothetical protein EAZ18_06155 [Oscillatoriales cyanobacterium]TAH22852.1 MAG: hypothetical protein EAZ09_09690 [Oscillatoriales cyanobacterium]